MTNSTQSEIHCRSHSKMNVLMLYDWTGPRSIGWNMYAAANMTPDNAEFSTLQIFDSTLAWTHSRYNFMGQRKIWFVSAIEFLNTLRNTSYEDKWLWTHIILLKFNNSAMWDEWQFVANVVINTCFCAPTFHLHHKC